MLLTRVDQDPPRGVPRHQNSLLRVQPGHCEGSLLVGVERHVLGNVLVVHQQAGVFVAFLPVVGDGTDKVVLLSCVDTFLYYWTLLFRIVAFFYPPALIYGSFNFPISLFVSLTLNHQHPQQHQELIPAGRWWCDVSTCFIKSLPTFHEMRSLKTTVEMPHRS